MAERSSWEELNLQQGRIYMIHIFDGDGMSSYCVDLDNGKSDNGTVCQAWDSDGATAIRNMLWRAHGPDSLGYWMFENVASGTWLDMEPTKDWGQRQVYGWGGNGTDAQRWEVQCRHYREVTIGVERVKLGDAGCRVRNKGRDRWMAYGPGIPGVFMGMHNTASIVGINDLIEKHYFYFVETSIDGPGWAIPQPIKPSH